MPDSEDAAAAQDYAFQSPRYAWMVVLILCGLQFISNMERQILGLVVEPLRRDFSLQDTDIALLQGIAFALFYSLVALPIGWLADRWRRDRIILIGMGLWSLATIGCMVAKSYGMLFSARLLIGLADAALLPASFSLLSDYFPRQRLAGAVGTVTGASFFGTGASLLLGGPLLGVLPAGLVNLPVVGAVHGWQLSFGLLCLPGFALMLLTLAVREPPRRAAPGDADAARSHGVGEVLRYFFAHLPYLGCLLAGIILLSGYQVGVTNWAVSLFIRRYGWTAGQIGLLYGLYFMIIGTIASTLGGRISDYLATRRGRKDANFLVPMGSVMVLIPLAILFPINGVAWLSAALLGVLTFLAVLSFGPAMAAIPAYVPSSLRAQMIALTMACSTLIGNSGGPWLVAWFTEDVFGDPNALPWSLAICAGLLLVPSALFFALGARAARRLM